MYATYATKTGTASLVHVHLHEQLRGDTHALTIELVTQCQGSVIYHHAYSEHRAKLDIHLVVTP